MFVNLSRRSQSLVERQIRLIDDLEQGEQDPERLSSLFQMDHLATRMRRNSENLLVLAGTRSPRRWNQPLALVDVLRAALSEIEQYERVTLNVQPGIVVRGQAVSDVVHLTAELVENATSFSAAGHPVTIAGHLLNSGGALMEITDQGVGMGPRRWRTRTGGWTTRHWWTWRCRGGWACSWWPGWRPGTASGSGCARRRQRPDRAGLAARRDDHG